MEDNANNLNTSTNTSSLDAEKIQTFKKEVNLPENKKLLDDNDITITSKRKYNLLKFCCYFGILLFILFLILISGFTGIYLHLIDLGKLAPVLNSSFICNPVYTCPSIPVCPKCSECTNNCELNFNKSIPIQVYCLTNSSS
jgi:hypothetical protein